MAKFEELRSRSSIEAVTELLGIATTPKQDDPTQLKATCPKCQRGKHDLSISTIKQRFTCWTSGARGDLIDLFAHVRSFDSNQKAGEALKELLDNPPEPETPPHEQKAPAHLQKVLTSLVPTADGIKDKDKAKALLDLGLSKETCQHFQAGYAAQGTMAGRFCIALHSPLGELVGFVGVALDERKPRFKFPDNIVRGNLIFNIHRVREARELIVAADPLMVLIGFENGETDVISYLNL